MSLGLKCDQVLNFYWNAFDHRRLMFLFVGFQRFWGFCLLMLFKPCNIQWFWYQRSVASFLGNLTTCTEFLKTSWCVLPVPQMSLSACSPSQLEHWDLTISHISTCIFMCLYPRSFADLQPWMMSAIHPQITITASFRAIKASEGIWSFWQTSKTKQPFPAISLHGNQRISFHSNRLLPKKFLSFF